MIRRAGKCQGGLKIASHARALAPNLKINSSSKSVHSVVC